MKKNLPEILDHKGKTPLVVMTAYEPLGISYGMAIRLSLLSAGLWWGVFTIIPVLAMLKTGMGGVFAPLVASRFNSFVVESLIAGALDTLRRHGVAAFVDGGDQHAFGDVEAGANLRAVRQGRAVDRVLRWRLVGPVLVLITGLLVPLGILPKDTMSYQRVLAFLQNPLGKLALLAVISLFLFHGVHRFVTTLNDYGMRGGHTIMAVFVGIAALLSVLTAGLLIGIGF